MDMGKANVPQRVLNKKDPLTPEEWEIVKSHSRLGSEMAAAVPFLADTAECILHHHEYWNGSGYPDGLKGEQIPIESRILGGRVGLRCHDLRPAVSRPIEPGTGGFRDTKGN